MQSYVCVKDVLTFLNSPSISRVSIIRIAIIFDDGLICKCLCKALFVDIVFQTPLRRVRTMKHISRDNRVKLRKSNGIWDLCWDERIDLFHSTNFELLFKENQEMHVWQATLLILNGVNQASHFPKVLFILNHFEQGLLFDMKDSSNQVWSIHSRLIYDKNDNEFNVSTTNTYTYTYQRQNFEWFQASFHWQSWWEKDQVFDTLYR